MASFGDMNGSVDPETLYTKQSCIGMVIRTRTMANANGAQAEAALAKYTRGEGTTF